MRTLRYTLRFLAAHRSFTAAAVFTLAIGLGANTALFGLMNVVLRPLEVPHAEQLVFGYFIFEIGAVQAAGMGLLGVALALVGVYGVVSFGASLRTREVGIRMALGAQPRDVLRLILGQGIRVVAVGLVTGLAATWALSRALMTFVPLARADWVIFVLIALALGALAAWACYLPALRATKVPAMTALRHE